VSDVVYMKGQGGAVWKMTLPLQPAMQKQFEAGDLVRVNPDGSPYEEPQPARRRTAAKADGD